MLWYFTYHPVQYWVPVAVNLILMILSARFLGRFYRGEAKIMKDPIIIFFASLCWPLVDCGLLVWAAAWLAGKVIKFLIGKNAT